GDRYDKRLISAACMLMHMSGLLLLTYAFSLVMVVGFAVLHGVAWGLRGPFMQALRADYFGRSAIGMILGLSFLIIMVGQVGGAHVFAGFAGNLLHCLVQLGARVIRDVLRARGNVAHFVQSPVGLGLLFHGLLREGSN